MNHCFCTPTIETERTLVDSSATGIATPGQQTTTIRHGIRIHAATVIATALQQGSCTGDQEAPSTTAPVATPGSLTAHRLAKELIAAAMRRCDQFNDGEAARAEMRQQCLELPPHLQRDLLEHFKLTCTGIDFEGVIDQTMERE